MASYDVFGDLRDWGCVLRQIDGMRADGTLDMHQYGLARVARYPCNWQLRQAALRGIAELKAPAEAAVDVALRILLDDGEDLETRILAGDALARVLSACGIGRSSGIPGSGVRRSVQALMEVPQPPVLHASISRCCEALNHPLEDAAVR